MRIISKTIGFFTLFVLIIGLITNLFFPFSLIILLAFAVIVSGVYYFKPLIKRFDQTQIRQLIWLIFGIMLIIQIAILLFTPATVYHDPFRVYFQAEQLALHQHNWGDISYFWRYPNNASFAILLSWAFKFTNFLGISTNAATAGMALIFYDGLIASLLYMARMLGQSPARRLGLVAFFALAPLSYTYAIQVFYTDTPSLVFLAWIGYILIRWPHYQKKQRLIIGPLLVLIVLLGQLTKPNLIVMAIAVVLWLGYIFLHNRAAFKKRALVPAALVLLGFALSMPIKSAILQSADYTHNPKYELPATSWIYMSLNPKHAGIYVGSDVQTVLALPDKNARSKFLAKAIPERIGHYNPFTLFAHFIAKLGVLTSSQTLPQAYTGGHTASPVWYQRNQLLLQDMARIAQQVLWSVFYFFVALTFGRNLLNKKYEDRSVNQTTMLISLTILGYAAFHTLVWETESRYGLILLPLIFLLYFVQPKQSNLANKYFKATSFKPLLGILIVVTLASCLLAPMLARPIDVVVNAQRSQLSEQYGAAPFEVEAHRFITQEVNLGTKTSAATIQIPTGSKLTGTITNLHTYKQFALEYRQTSNGTFLTNKKAIPAGDYQITLANNTNQNQPIWLVSLVQYKLAPHSVKGNQVIPDQSSLIYTFYDQQQPLLW